MKNLIGAVVALMMLLVPAAMGNTMTQTNDAEALGSGVCGIITQNALNAGLAIGADNSVTQENIQYATSANDFCIEQNAANLALVIGTDNVVSQTNDAWAIGGFTDQDQINVVAVLGHFNDATQLNYATARSERLCINPIFQNQANLGLIIGVDNSLDQTNDACAIIPKDTNEDPLIVQNQLNIGVLLSATTCHEEPEPEPEPDPVPPCTCGRDIRTGACNLCD